jgi:hypothetical protein
MRPKDQIPTYDQAVKAMENGDNDTLENALFAFTIDDGYYIEQVTKAVRGLLKRPGLTPRQIVSIGRALHGLERLPLRTPGLDIQISLVDKINDAASSYHFFISTDRFATESGGYDNFGFGTDSFSGPTFEVEYGFREYDSISIPEVSWSNIFSEMTAAELQIEDNSEDSLMDWDHPDGSIFWEWIANHD